MYSDGLLKLPIFTIQKNHKILLTVYSLSPRPNTSFYHISILSVNFAWRNLYFFQKISYNIFYDYIRSRKETADLDTREIDAINSTEQENIGQKMDVYQSLKMLKEVERTCITLFYMEDISIDKIAGIVGVPSGTVKSHLSRGKEKLATYLKQNGYDRNRQW